jgi:hypothetical protein
MVSTWESARRQILARLQEVGRLIECEDEGGVLALINQKDEFCDTAEDRKAVAPMVRRGDSACDFCEGFLQSGGCVGMLARINHAVMAGDWAEAGRVNEEYVRWVQGLSLHG